MMIKQNTKWRWKHAPEHTVEVQQASNSGVLYVTESGTMMCMDIRLFVASFEPVEDVELCKLREENAALTARIAELEAAIIEAKNRLCV